MNTTFVDAVQICLVEIQNGSSPERAADRFPRYTDRLLPLLVTAGRAYTHGRFEIPAAVPIYGQARLTQSLVRLERTPVRRAAPRWSWKFAFVAAILAVIMAFSAQGTLAAAAHSLPGDRLYPLKRAVETVELGLTFDPVKRQQLAQTFEQRRVEETNDLIAAGLTETVDFTGSVTGSIPNGWRVDSLPVQVTGQTQVEGNIVVGCSVHLIGVTHPDGKITAILLAVTNGASNSGDSLASASGTPSQAASVPAGLPATFLASGTPTPEPTDRSTHTPKPENTNKPATNTPKSTNTPKPTNTHKPVENTPKPTNSNKPADTPGSGNSQNSDKNPKK